MTGKRKKLKKAKTPKAKLEAKKSKLSQREVEALAVLKEVEHEAIAKGERDTPTTMALTNLIAKFK